MTKEVFLDYDGTLVDFEQPWLDKINNKEGSNITPLNKNEPAHKELIKPHYGMINKEGNNHYDDVPLFDGAIDFTDTLKANGYILKILTSYMSKNQMNTKDVHIKENFGEDYFDEIIHLSSWSKTKKDFYTKNGIIVDDGTKNIMKHVDSNDTLGILLNVNDMHYMDEEHLNELKGKSNFLHLNSFESILDSLNIPKHKRVGIFFQEKPTKKKKATSSNSPS